jgi:hypothetical protein
MPTARSSHSTCLAALNLAVSLRSTGEYPASDFATEALLAVQWPYWVMAVLGLAGIAGAAIDYRKGCGVSAVAIGVNSAWLFCYAVYPLVIASQPSLGNYNASLLFLRLITSIGFVANGVILAHIFRPLWDRRRRILDKLPLVYLIFMTGGLAGFSVGSMLVNRSLVRVAGVIFSAALLAALAGIVIAFIRIRQTRLSVRVRS